MLVTSITNGVTIAVAADKLIGLHIEVYEQSPLYKVVDEEMRVYAGIAAHSYYILGDAYGYIRAFIVHQGGICEKAGSITFVVTTLQIACFPTASVKPMPIA